MRCGKLLRAAEGGVKLDGFELPQLDSRFLVITAEDITGENAVDIMGTKIPLLADGYVAYKGQPLLVLFGPDYESTELALDKVKVKTSKADENDTAPQPLPDPLTFSWGLEDEDEIDKEKAGERKVETNLKVSPSEIKKYVRYSVLTWTEANGSVHTQCPAQWSELVRKTIASSTLTESDCVTLHSEKYLSHYDEFLLTPALYGAFTALAAIKTKLPSEMIMESMGRKPGLDFTAVTWLDEDNKPRHEEISVTLDGGAYALGGEEVQRIIMAGLPPRYDLESFKAEVKSVSSPSIPTLFGGACLQSAVQSFLAVHSTRLAEKADLTPVKHYLKTSGDNTRFTQWMPKHDLTDLSERIKNVAADSDYERKWSAGLLNRGDFGLRGYLYGIGLSSGLSMSGMSTTAARENQFQARISYTPRKNIMISGAVPSSITQDKMLKDMISQFFASNSLASSLAVTFSENNLKGCDSGPDVLSSYQTIFLSQLMKAANKFSSLIVDDSPVELKFNAQNLSLPCEFEASGGGAAVCEIRIPKVSLVPVARELWLDVSLALPYTRGAVKRIKAVATETLSSLGAELSDDFVVNVKFSSSRKDTNVYSSLENTTRFLVTAAYTASLWQAMGARGTIEAPLTAKRIDAILQGGQDR